jgi:hypothetical protein
VRDSHTLCIAAIVIAGDRTRCCWSWVSAVGQPNRTNGHTSGALADVGYER